MALELGYLMEVAMIVAKTRKFITQTFAFSIFLVYVCWEVQGSGYIGNFDNVT